MTKHITTIEDFFQYRIGQLITGLIRCDMTYEEMQAMTTDDLENWIAEKARSEGGLGQGLVEDMYSYTDIEDWLKEVQKLDA